MVKKKPVAFLPKDDSIEEAMVTVRRNAWHYSANFQRLLIGLFRETSGIDLKRDDGWCNNYEQLRKEWEQYFHNGLRDLRIIRGVSFRPRFPFTPDDDSIESAMAAVRRTARLASIHFQQDLLLELRGRVLWSDTVWRESYSRLVDEWREYVAEGGRITPSPRK